MTTILETTEGRCDATCHYAREKHCSCICRGRYHGARGRALERLREDIATGQVPEQLAGAAEASSPPELFDASKAIEPASPEQWQRAIRMCGSRAVVLSRVRRSVGDPRLGVSDITKGHLADVIAKAMEKAS